MNARLVARALAAPGLGVMLSAPVAGHAQVTQNGGTCNPPVATAGPSGQVVTDPTGGNFVWADPTAGSVGAAGVGGYLVVQQTGATGGQVGGYNGQSGLNGFAAGDPSNPMGGSGCIGVLGTAGVEIHPGP